MNSSTSPGEREIIDLAVAEGHDAEIPSNEGYITAMGFVKRVKSNHSASPSGITPSTKSMRVKGHKEIDIEKESISRQHSEADDSLDDDDGRSGLDPNIVSWDGDNDPQK